MSPYNSLVVIWNVWNNNIWLQPNLQSGSSWLSWLSKAGYAAWGPWSPAGIRAKIKPQIEAVERQRGKSEFFYHVYSEVPFAVQQGKILSSSEALEKLPQELVNSLTPEELAQARQTIDDMVHAITGVQPLPEMAKDMPELQLPELKAPQEVVTKIPMMDISRMTVNELGKALFAPKPPSPVFNEEEWKEYLSARQGGVDDPEADYLSSQAEELVNSWKERDNQLTAFKEGIAEMPDYEVVDMLKDAVVQPGLALMETANIYFTYVTQPLAGAFI